MAKKKKQFDIFSKVSDTIKKATGIDLPNVANNIAREAGIIKKRNNTIKKDVSQEKKFANDFSATTIKTSDVGKDFDNDTEKKDSIITQKIKPVNKQVVNSDGYKDTGKKYGDYAWQHYKDKKDYKVYTKKGKAYYYDDKDKKYHDMDESGNTTYLSAPGENVMEKEKKEAIKQGYKEKKYYKTKKGLLGERKERIEPKTYAEKVALDTSKVDDKKLKKIKEKSERNVYKKHNPTLEDRVRLYTSGLLTKGEQALAAIPDTLLQETQNQLQQGKKEGKKANSTKDLINKTYGQLGKSFFHLVAPRTAKFADDMGWLGQKPQWKRKQSFSSVFNEMLGQSDIINGTSTKALKEDIKALGMLKPEYADTVKGWRKGLNKPGNEMQKDLDLQKDPAYKDFNGVDRTIEGVNEIVGTMGPSIATSAITKNPKLGLATMAASVKGQATKEAEDRGLSLDDAIKYGNTMAAIETGTELLTGGLNFFGKGALDDIAEKGIDNIIKNKAGNFLAKKGAGVLGENVEEQISNILGNIVDKQEIDKNSKYTLDDALKTLKDTTLSTMVLNGLGGGYSKRAYKQNSDLLDYNEYKDILEDQKKTNIKNELTGNADFLHNAADNVAKAVNNIPESVSDFVKNGNVGTEVQQQIKDGRFGKKMMLDLVSNQKVQQIQQDLSEGKISPYEANMEMDLVKETVESQRKLINKEAKKGFTKESPLTLQDFEEAFNQIEQSNLPEQVKLEAVKELTKASEQVNKTKQTPYENVLNTNPIQEKIQNITSGENMVPEEIMQNDFVKKQQPISSNNNVTPEEIMQSDFAKPIQNISSKTITPEQAIQNDFTNQQQVEEVNKLNNIEKNVDKTNNIDYNENDDVSSFFTLDNSKKNKLESTVAPYYDTELTKTNFNRLKNKVGEDFANTATKITTLLGGQIKNANTNIGGYTFEDANATKNKIKELSYTFELEKMPKKKADLMASLLGDLGHEQQESVITSKYTDINKANTMEINMKYKNRDALINALTEIGIDDFTIDTNNKTLKIYEEMMPDSIPDIPKKLIKLIKQSGGNVYEGKYSGVNSSFIDKSTRERIYSEWLKTNEGGKENGELRSLIEQAYQKVEGSIEKDNRQSKYEEYKNLVNEGSLKKGSLLFDEYKKLEKEFNPSGIETKPQQTEKQVETKPVKQEQTKQIEITPEAKKEAAKALSDEVNKGIKNRSYVLSAIDAFDAEDLAKGMKESAKGYTQITNEKTYQKAKNKLDKMDYESRVAYIKAIANSNKKIKVGDIAEAQLVLQEAAMRNDAKNFQDILQTTALFETEAGQIIQYASTLRKMTPIGQIKMLNKIIDRGMNKNYKKWKDVELDENMTKKILDCYNKDGTFNQQEMDEAVEEVKQNIADQLKMTISEKANAWRYLSMLGNPKTHIRNMMANVAMYGVKGVKNTISSGLQDLIIHDKSKKTTTLARPTKEVLDYTKKVYEENKNQMQQSKYDEKSGIEDKQRAFKGKIMNGLYKGNTWLLEAEDRLFKSPAFKKSFAKFLTAQGIKTQADIDSNPKVITQAKQHALYQALEATFQQKNGLANFINRADKNALGRVVRGAIIPFTRTPLNIAKTGIEYTPVTGFATTYNAVKNAPDNLKAATFIDSISKQATGSSLALVGYMLAKAGVLKAGGEGDKEDKYLKDLGDQDYSITVNGKSYELSWLSPSAMPMFVGASFYNQLEKKEKITPDVVVNSIINTTDPLSTMSCVKSFTDTLQSYSGKSGPAIGQAVQRMVNNYVTQYIPTLSGQIAAAFDDKKRMTSPDKTSNFSWGDDLQRQIGYKLPFIRNEMEEKTDSWGRTIYEEKDPATRAFRALLSPATVKKKTADKTDYELLDLYKETGESKALPAKAQKYLEYDKERYNLSHNEYNRYKKTYGDIARPAIKELMKSDDYKNADSEKRLKMVDKIYKYASYKAKKEYYDENDVDYKPQSYKTYALYDAFDIPINEMAKVSLSDIRSDKDIYGNSIRGSYKRNMANAINALNLSIPQKAALLRKNTMYNKKPTYKQYKTEIAQQIVNSDLTLEMKKELLESLGYSVRYK